MAAPIFRLEPILVPKPWGIAPERFETVVGPRAGFDDPVGELWTGSALTDIEGRSNLVMQGDGRTIDQLIDDLGQDFLGTAVTEDIRNTPRGKTEAWTIRHLQGRVVIVGGMRPEATAEEFARRAREGFFERDVSLQELTELFQVHEPEVGATYLSRPGTIHTVLPLSDDAEMVFDEVQEGFGHNPLPTLSKVLAVGKGRISLQVHPSDDDVAGETDPELVKRYAEEPTLRVSDFGGGRPIQPEAALKVTRTGEETFSKIAPVVEILEEGVRRCYVVACKHFVRCIVTAKPGCGASIRRSGRHYDIVHVAGGIGTIVADGAEVHYEHGHTYAVPACTADFEIRANSDTRLVIDYLDDLRALQHKLTCAGFREHAIKGLAGGAPENELR